MKDKRINTNRLRVNKFVYLIVFFLFVIFGITLGYRCLADYKVNNILFSEFIANRNIKEEFVKFIKENKVGKLEDVSGYYEGFYVSVAVTPEEERILNDKLDKLYDKYEFTECVKLQ